ncbi:MAG: NfeD family protein [Bacteroidales bacterium]|nr:NfeD family protein [Bacteroidales bacterium]
MDYSWIFLIAGGLGLLFIVLYVCHLLFNTERSKSSIVVLNSDQEGYIGTDTSVLGLCGKRGTAITDLRPGGKVDIDGKRLDAVSNGPFIAKGTDIVVIEASASQAVVEKA